MDRWQRNLMTIIEEEGFNLVQLNKSKHFKFTVSIDGKERLIVSSISPSGVMAANQFRRDLRKIRRELTGR